MEVRKSTKDDIADILAIYETAREFMKTHGNPTQWGDVHPLPELLYGDIERGNSYVIRENGETVGTFALIFGEEPTYRLIENGHFRSDAPYGTIHRLASNFRVRGIARACFEYCRDRIDYLRVDTHADNLPMQAAATRFGFRPCGIIYVRDNSPRIAFDYRKGDSDETL